MTPVGVPGPWRFGPGCLGNGAALRRASGAVRKLFLRAIWRYRMHAGGALRRGAVAV